MAGKVALGSLDGDTLWAAIEKKVADRIADLQLQITHLQETATIGEVRYLQGQIFELRWVLNFPTRELKTLMAELRSTRDS